MAFRLQRAVNQSVARARLIGDQQTGLLHTWTCPARPQHGVEFNDREQAVARGYTYCTCTMPPLVATPDRIRALLATTSK